MGNFKNSKAHHNEHVSYSRRNFLSTLGVAGAGSLILGNLNVTGLSASPLSAMLNNSSNDRILLLIRLNGGNDGLNTIIPINEYDLYATKRPTIKIPENDILSLQNEFGMPSYMQDLMPFWEEGNMNVIHGVGYDNQDLSHFRSTDIWSSGSDANIIDNTGWLGRFTANEFPEYLVNPPSVPPAVQIGASATFNASFDDGLIDMGFSVSDPVQMAAIAENGQLYSLTDVPDCYYGEQLKYLRTVTNSTYTFTDSIFNAYQNASNDVDYQSNKLSDQLALVARFIKGNLGTKIYMVNLGGFDTHDAQKDEHRELMEILSTSLAQFYEDIGVQKDNVLSMVFSEFGRRIEENASLGTDHGAAAPILLFGGNLSDTEQRSYGNMPSLSDPDAVGNLKHNVDFRSVYATILQDWLCVPGELTNYVMGSNFDRIEGMLQACENEAVTSVENRLIINDINHFVYQENKETFIKLDLRTGGALNINVLNVSGQKVAELFNGYLSSGKHEFKFNPAESNIPIGIYMYQILKDEKQYSGKLTSFRF